MASDTSGLGEQPMDRAAVAAALHQCAMFEWALKVLSSRGHTITPANIPGLWNVSGHSELTINQLINVARKATQ